MVSIIIPLYNGAATIVRTLDSVKNQTYKDFEIIIVNDGSIDNSAKVVEEYKNKNSGLKITFINKNNGGVSSARNEGMKTSKGELIAFLDSDDEWLPPKLEKQLNVFKKNTSIDFLAATISDPKDKIIGELKIINLRMLIFKNYFQPSTVIMKRKVYDTVGDFNEFQRYAEEGNYFIRVANKFTCALLCEKLINYGDGKSGFGESGLSANLLEMEKGELMNLSFAYHARFIGRITYYTAKYYSMIKYLRRVLIVKTRKT